MIMITGGYGFIGSHLARLLLSQKKEIVIVDCLTYAANPEFVRTFARDKKLKYHDEIIDIRDHLAVARLITKYRPETIYHLAAESHVCRSLKGPKDFVTTNVMGTFNLLEEFRHLYGDDQTKRFVHVSTDEVFGELTLTDPPFSERTAIQPRSPYAATKASSDLLAQAYFHSYGVNVVITNCSNNFGPNQNREKLIPNAILRMKNREPVRLYGNGQNIRDWLWVEDHAKALTVIREKGKAGERYCIGGENELTNMEVVNRLHAAMEIKWGAIDLEIEFTNDRPTDDRRYAINCDKTKALGWQPSRTFADNLLKTIDYYGTKKHDHY